MFNVLQVFLSLHSLWSWRDIEETLKTLVNISKMLSLGIVQLFFLCFSFIHFLLCVWNSTYVCVCIYLFLLSLYFLFSFAFLKYSLCTVNLTNYKNVALYKFIFVNIIIWNFLNFKRTYCTTYDQYPSKGN